MNFIGVDLHKQSITVCVMNQDRDVLMTGRFRCDETDRIAAWFRDRRPFQMVVEATASYEWFVQLVEAYSDRVVLAHPGKLRVIAESTRKSDRLDARVLAEFLARDMIPEAYRATPRQREHRRLIRQREWLSRRQRSVKVRMRRILADYNADRPDLFTAAGRQAAGLLKLSSADRLAMTQMWSQYDLLRSQMAEVMKALRVFAETASESEAEARRVVGTITGVGPVTVEAFLAELADVRRFRSQKRAAAYVGLAPGQRESAGVRRSLGITHQGSGLLRRILNQAAWRVVRLDPRWRRIFDGLAKRRGKKKAIVAISRRLLCVMVSLVQSGQSYRPAA